MWRPRGWSFRPKDLKKDLGAGIVHGLASVPDGLASGILAGVSPVSGLYGYMFGAVAGATATSSVFMSVQGTGAMAAVIADIPQVSSGANPEAALATLGILTGLVMLALGLFRLGTLVRFVPHSVLVGFVNGVAINIVLGQLGNFTGYSSPEDHRVVAAGDTVVSLQLWSVSSVLVGFTALALIILLEKTPLGAFSLFAGVAIASALPALFDLGPVQLVRDIAELPQGLPMPIMPAFNQAIPLIVPSLSLAFVGLVQGAAISQSIPNPDGKFPDISGDFRGQGVANIVSGFFRGTPVGGSMSGTAVLKAAGAHSRTGNLVAGLVMAASVLFFSHLIGQIAMPALAALLILVGIRMVKLQDLLTVYRTGKTQSVVLILTFSLTLLIPLQYAVLTGIAMSTVLFVARQSNKVVVVRWLLQPGTPYPTEEAPPAIIAKNDLVILSIYGSLFFASAAVFEAQLPRADEESRGAVVVLRLRGKEDLGSTFAYTIKRYSQSLSDVGCHLIIAGVDRRVVDQLSSAKALEHIGMKNIFPATAVVGESLLAGIRRAEEIQGDYKK